MFNYGSTSVSINQLASESQSLLLIATRKKKKERKKEIISRNCFSESDFEHVF